MNLSLNDLIRAVNAGGVVSVLVLALWLGLRGDVVTAEQLRDCRMSRDAYLRDLLRVVLPAEQARTLPPSLQDAREDGP